MVVYCVVMFAVSVLFSAFSILIYKGKTDLIHDYHQKKVKEEEKAAYGKAFSKGMFGMAASMILSGAVALLGESKSFMIASLVVLFLGFAVSIAVLLRVQKKYNGGVF